MGRRIVRKNFPEEPEKHSRLWESEDICEVLKEQKGTGVTSVSPNISFRQIDSGFGHPVNVDTEEFPNWISQSVPSTVSPVNNAIGEKCFQSTLSLNLLSNVPHKFLG
ncbi:hypothetical protein POM88_020094 [Heracleum sosnowskyi]|uniref:Uncharacterized protein n=1 Tax=Heracleum sosnowskyi TaxID=360622 RepID=A0AAD8IAW8_9APIA|nr:hypothetical protein POM88_020094 [Heracleum sosnowskyi]